VIPLKPLKIYRIFLLVLASMIFLLVGIGLNIIFALNGRLRARAAAVGTMMWARSMCRVLGVHMARTCSVADVGFFTVCNHMSYVDILVLGSVRPSAFLSKHEVKSWPIIGQLAMLGGTVFVKRGSKRAAVDSMREIRQKIEAGIAVIIFPEGTTSEGKEIMPFKSTFFKVPASMNIPVTPASIRYAPEVRNEVAWYGGMELVPHFWKVMGIRKIEVALHFSPPISGSPDGTSLMEERKRLCAKAYESVVEGFNACGTMER
jgi:1-acyl-sn-glycerol-3-phosphate acyltransferase